MSKKKSIAMPMFLALLMALSVVGFSYSPDETTSATGAAPASTVEFQGISFDYVPETQQYQGNIQGTQILFYSSPQDVERQGYPIPSFENVEQVVIHVPSSADEQQEFIAQQMQSDLTNRLPIPVSQGERVCDDDSTITVSMEGEERFEQVENNCYATGLTDQSVLLVQDHLVLAQYGLLQ